jgi:hypothetical protein
VPFARGEAPSPDFAVSLREFAGSFRRTFVPIHKSF